MLRLINFAVALSIVPVLAFAGPALAAAEGQVEGGDIYRIRNVTKGSTDFVDPANADACDTLMYRVRLHNPGPGELTNVIVKATLPGGSASTHTSTMTTSSINADPESTSDNAVLNLSSSQSLSYVSGSTQLLDSMSNPISSLPDGITGGGVSIGNLGVSLDNVRRVQFQVRVSCPVTPVVTPPTVTPVSKPAPAAPKPAALPNTGVGDVLGLFTGASAAGAAGHYIYSRRRG